VTASVNINKRDKRSELNQPGYSRSDRDGYAVKTKTVAQTPVCNDLDLLPGIRHHEIKTKCGLSRSNGFARVSRPLLECDLVCLDVDRVYRVDSFDGETAFEYARCGNQVSSKHDGTKLDETHFRMYSASRVTLLKVEENDPGDFKHS